MGDGSVAPLYLLDLFFAFHPPSLSKAKRKVHDVRTGCARESGNGFACTQRPARPQDNIRWKFIRDLKWACHHQTHDKPWQRGRAVWCAAAGKVSPLEVQFAHPRHMEAPEDSSVEKYLIALEGDRGTKLLWKLRLWWRLPAMLSRALSTPFH